jgi:mannose/cellobiose epimerase-like protein (N-acyl-D-glucosamine 2-epimerase family)
METIKTGMVSVHTEYQALQAEWARLMLTLRSRKADTEAVEKAMIMLAAVALRLAMDIRAQAVRTGTYVLDDKRERQPAEEVFAALSE